MIVRFSLSITKSCLSGLSNTADRNNYGERELLWSRTGLAGSAQGAALLTDPRGTLASLLAGRPLAHRPARRASVCVAPLQECRFCWCALLDQGAHIEFGCVALLASDCFLDYLGGDCDLRPSR
jgi:hypothetical protein